MKPNRPNRPWPKAPWYRARQKQPQARKSKWKRIKPQSTRQAKRMDAYRIARWAFLALAEHELCEVCLRRFKEHKTDKVRRATEVHHRRGRLGDLLMDERYWTAICRRHHRAIHDEPAKAFAEGWLESRLQPD